MTKRDAFSLGSLLLIAAILRIAWPGMTEFKADEARLLTLAYDMAEFKYFPLVGISNSAGLPNFPMSVWIYALPLFVWKHVFSATIFTGLLNTLAVLGCWWLTRRYWSKHAAFVATTLFAVNPWAIMHARKIWAQNLLAPFVIGWAICLILAIEEKRARWLIGALLCLAIAIQAHLAAVSLVPATLIVLLIYWRRVGWRPLLIGGGLSLLTLVPFVIYLLRDADLGQSGGMGRLISAEISTNALRHTWLLTTGREIHAYAGASAYEAYLAQVPDLTGVHILWIGLIILGIWRTVQRRRPVDLILLIWLACATFFFMWELVPVVLHYLLPTYPAQFVLAGIGFAWLLELGRPAVSRLSWGVVGLSAVAQIWVVVALLVFLQQNDSPGGFGTPLSVQLEAVTQTLLLREKVDAFEVLVMSDGAFPDVDNVPAIYELLLRGVPHRFVDATTSAVFPEGDSVVLAIEPERFPLVQMVAGMAVDSAETQLRNPDLTHSSYVLTTQPQPDIAFDPPYLLSNWVNLLGHTQPIYDEPAQTLDWRVVWRVGGGGPVDYHFSNRLLDADGSILGQQDAATFYAGQWRENDIVISRFLFEELNPSGSTVTMYTGMYHYPDLTPVQFLDEAANPFAESAEISFSLNR
ncbi:MAG: ArnT family glycosyltransferase [Candidatus Promineifilaceae bacterium]